MEEPREVTGPTGQKRWMARDGRSFGSIEEARNANASQDHSSKADPAQQPAPLPSTWKLVVGHSLALVLFGWLAGGGIYRLVTGQMSLKDEWDWLLLPIGLFLITGIALMNGVGVWAALAGRYDAKVFETAWEWWFKKLGCGILKLIGVLVVGLIVWSLLSNLFEGVSKGTGMIIILLFGILVVLATNGSNDRR